MEREGLIQVYTGNGKGKTTAALGLAVRALGHGFKVHIVQFLKGSSYTGELFTAQRLYPELQITQFGWGCPHSSLIRSGQDKCKKCGTCFQENRNPAASYASKGLMFCSELLQQQCCDLLILDEISHPIRHNLIQPEQLIELLKGKPKAVEIILTGRQMYQPIIDCADLVTEFMSRKHPYQKGMESRRGIEY